MLTNANYSQLEEALKKVNEKYNNNICFNRLPEKKGKKLNFTLKVKSSKGAGHRLGFDITSKGNRRRLASACWHVHGDFFEALFDIDPNIYIDSSGASRIDINGGNWQDRNIGSIMNPLYFSEACECNQ